MRFYLRQLHLRRLPDFDGRLRPHGIELLLQYLTVPYLRIPLVLDFFSEDTIYALQSAKLQAGLVWRSDCYRGWSTCPATCDSALPLRVCLIEPR